MAHGESDTLIASPRHALFKIQIEGDINSNMHVLLSYATNTIHLPIMVAKRVGLFALHFCFATQIYTLFINYISTSI